jgi:thiamine-phosphate diphosphorylase
VHTGDPSANAPQAIPVVHAVTTDDIVRRPTFLEQARAVMAALGARGAIQLRAPYLAGHAGGELLALARELATEQERTGAWVVVNDRVDIALMAGARGVQLAGQSMDVADACRIAANRHLGAEPRVGASVHSLEEAIAARLAGAGWAVTGHLFRHVGARASVDSISRHAGAEKDAAMADGMTLLDQLVRFGGFPIVAIGGIVPQHVLPLRKLGVHGVAAIRGIWDADDAGRAASDYLSAYDAQVGG